MFGDSGGGDTETTIRYPKYVEAHHKDFLDGVDDAVSVVLNMNAFSQLVARYSSLDWYDWGFFGAGHCISSYPSLFDMFGKFMGGLDVEVLWNQAFEGCVNNSTISNLVGQISSRLSQDVAEVQYPRMSAGMRDINSVLSSTFIVARAILETERTRAVEKYDAELRHGAMQLVNQRWLGHLQFNDSTIKNYTEMFRLYAMARVDLDTLAGEIRAKWALWPFTVWDYMRAALGALTGAQKTTQEVGGASSASKALGGAMAGAAGMAMMGAPGLGIAGGALAGALSGIL